MMLSRKMAAGTVGALVLGAGFLPAEAPDASSNPYGGIVERNVFALKDPPPPAKVDDPQPPPKFTLTGITTILGPKVAMFRSIPASGKGADASKQESYMLSEGQRKDDVEVVTIDENAGMVKIVCAGTPMTLDFTNNAAKAVAVATPAAPGAAGARGGVSVPGMPGNHPGFRQTGEGFGARRSMRTGQPAPGGGVPPGMSMGGIAPGGFAMGGAAPGVAVPAVTGAAAPNVNAQMSREENALLMEAVRAESTPEMPPVPPTPFTHAFQGGGEQAGGTGAGAGTGAAGGPPMPPMPPTPY